MIIMYHIKKYIDFFNAVFNVHVFDWIPNMDLIFILFSGM